MFMQNSINQSAAVSELLTVYWILDNCKLWSQISLERITQSTSGKRRYQLLLFPRSTKPIWWTLVHLRKNDL